MVEHIVMRSVCYGAECHYEISLNMKNVLKHWAIDLLEHLGPCLHTSSVYYGP